MTAAATTLAIRDRSGIALPAPSGWLRAERTTTNVSVTGSSHIDVPVQPVWPKEPRGKRSPRLVE